MFYDPTAKADPFELQDFMPWLSKADITAPTGKDIYSAITSAGLDQQLGSVWQPDMSKFSIFGDQAWDPYSSLSLENEGVRGLYTQALGQTQDSRLMDAYKSAMGYDQYKPDPYANTSFGGGNYGLSIGQIMGIDFSKMQEYFEGPEFAQAAKTWATEQTAAAQQKDARGDLMSKLYTDPNFKYQTTMEDWKNIAAGMGESPWNISGAGGGALDLSHMAHGGMLVGYQNGVPVYAGATGATGIGGQYLVDPSGNLTYMEGREGKGGFFLRHIGKYIPKEIRRYLPEIGSVIGTILGAGNPLFAALGSGIGSILTGASGQQILTNAGISAAAAYIFGGYAKNDLSSLADWGADQIVGKGLYGATTLQDVAAQNLAEGAASIPKWAGGALDTGWSSTGYLEGTAENLANQATPVNNPSWLTENVTYPFKSYMESEWPTVTAGAKAISDIPTYDKMRLLNVAISALQGPYEQPTAGMQNSIAGYLEQPTAGIEARGNAPGWKATDWKNFNAKLAAMGRGGGMVTGARANETAARSWYDRYLRENGYA